MVYLHPTITLRDVATLITLTGGRVQRLAAGRYILTAQSNANHFKRPHHRGQYTGAKFPDGPSTRGER